VARRVYVVELAREAGKRRDPRIPWVYVGSSARSPAERFEQHRRGYKSSRLAHRHGVRLRLDLYEDLPAFKSTDESVAAETTRAKQLAGAGFIAHSDGTSYGERAGDWREWGYRRLMQVSEHIDAAIIELVECTFHPAAVEACAHLLWGTRSFWVSDLIDQDDPPPAYGLFAHVRRDVLERRIEELVAAGRLRMQGTCLLGDSDADLGGERRPTGRGAG
jgi:hypothetical protein